MSNPLFVKLKMQLSVLTKEKDETELKIQRYFLEMSNYLADMYKPIHQIHANEIEQCGNDILNLKQKYLELEKKCNDIKSQLDLA